jgi:hypothetical protein
MAKAKVMLNVTVVTNMATLPRIVGARGTAKNQRK